MLWAAAKRRFIFTAGAEAEREGALPALFTLGRPRSLPIISKQNGGAIFHRSAILRSIFLFHSDSTYRSQKRIMMTAICARDARPVGLMLVPLVPVIRPSA